MVVNARSKPAVIAACGDRSRASSRTREKISTLASTAIPIVSTMPAIPGIVSVAPSTDINATSRITLIASAMFAIMPNAL